MLIQPNLNLNQSQAFNPSASDINPSSPQLAGLLQDLLKAMFSLMMASQQTTPSNQAALSQGSPDFGQSACSCGNGADSLSQFLGARKPTGNLPQPGPQGSSFQTGGETPANDPDTSSQSPSSGTPNLQALVQALPAGRRQAASQHFPTILAECQRQNVTDSNQISYILATAAHESNAGQTMEEFASGHAYEGRSSLGNTQAGDGPRYKGRGYVQITGRRNYTDWSQRLGMDLVGNPSLATQPRVAARILVEGMMRGTFTGRALPDYVGNGRNDLSNARRVVNGTDRAADIAGIAQRLRSAMA